MRVIVVGAALVIALGMGCGQSGSNGNDGGSAGGGGGGSAGGAGGGSGGGAGGGSGGGGGASVSGTSVFVTSVAGSGDLSSWPDAAGKSGLAAADAICQARANAAGLGGTFVAWLSDPQNDAYCRLHGLTGKVSANCGQAALPATAGPWSRTDGLPFADRIDLMVNQARVFTPLAVDEHGQPVTTQFWSNTSSTGEYVQQTNSCADFTSGDSSTTGPVGALDRTAAGWTSASSQPDCSSSQTLACFEVGPGVPLAFPTPTGKHVFLTSVTGNGNLGSWADAAGKSGAAAGDSICQARAAAASLPNASSYKAFLGGTNLTSAGPWYRLDGIKVLESSGGLQNGALLAPINLTETGSYRGDEAWVDRGAGRTCSGWTDGTSASSGSYGRASFTSAWAGASYTLCSVPFHLYCFED